jgi:ribosome-associated protein
MANDRSTDEFPEEFEGKSKSQLKREMHGLQKLGEALVALKPGQVAEISMSERLRAAIEEAWRLRQNEAKRRHMQYLGKLMRHEDVEQLQKAIDGFNAGSEENTRRLHLAERWRERLLAEDTAVTEFLAEHPEAEAQHLRNLVRNGRQDLALARNGGHSRKLFRYIRDQLDQQVL